MSKIAPVLLRWLSFERQELKTPDDEPEAAPLEKIRAAVCEVAELFALRFADAFPQLPHFVQAVWEMLGKCPREEKYDVVSFVERIRAVWVSRGREKFQREYGRATQLDLERVRFKEITCEGKSEISFQVDWKSMGAISETDLFFFLFLSPLFSLARFKGYVFPFWSC